MTIRFERNNARFPVRRVAKLPVPQCCPSRSIRFKHRLRARQGAFVVARSANAARAIADVRRTPQFATIIIIISMTNGDAAPILGAIAAH